LDTDPLSKSNKVREALKKKKKRRVLVRKFLIKKFKKTLSLQCKAFLRSPYVKNLRKTQFKDSVKVTKREGKVTKEIISLPANIIESESIEELKKFATMKFTIEIVRHQYTDIVIDTWYVI
jgi:hypothetical protein